jgi:hypothetical protein
VPREARVARWLLWLAWLPIRPTPAALRQSALALVCSATYGIGAMLATTRQTSEAAPNSQMRNLIWSEGLQSTLPLIPVLYACVHFSLALVKGCVLHRLMLDYPDPAHLRRVALVGLRVEAMSNGLVMFLEGYGFYRDWGLPAPFQISDAEWRATRFVTLPIKLVNMLFGIRITFHLCAFSYLCVRESARVLVLAVTRFESDLLSVLDAEHGNTPASLYEALHECEIRLRVQFQLSRHPAPPTLVPASAPLMRAPLMDKHFESLRVSQREHAVCARVWNHAADALLRYTLVRTQHAHVPGDKLSSDLDYRGLLLRNHAGEPDGDAGPPCGTVVSDASRHRHAEDDSGAAAEDACAANRRLASRPYARPHVALLSQPCRRAMHGYPRDDRARHPHLTGGDAATARVAAQCGGGREPIESRAVDAARSRQEAELFNRTR